MTATYEEYHPEPDEVATSITPLEWFPEPDECDECKAWCYDRDDHASTCSRYAEQCLPF